MALVKDVLKNGIIQALKNAQNLNGPDGPSGAAPYPLPQSIANELGSAYHTYASSAMAGVLVPIGLVPTSLQSSLVAPMQSGWLPGLLAYWSPVTWTAPGFVPSPTVPAALSGISPQISTLMNSKANSLEEFADSLSTILHTYTQLIIVTATTVVGVATPTPLA